MEEKNAAAYAAEFVGTFLLVMFIGLILSSNNPAGLGFTDFAVIGLLHAFLLMMLVATLGGTSGAHFNPAISVTLAAVRRISWVDAAIYIFLQLLGAIAGALVVKLVVAAPADAVNYGAPALNDKFVSTKGAGFACELIGTFALMWAVMGTAVNPNAPKGVAGIAIGGTLGFAVMVFGPATGGSFNPARWFGPALTSGTWTDGWMYIVAPIIGAVLSAFVYSWVMESDRRVLPAQTPRRGESAEPPPPVIPAD